MTTTKRRRERQEWNPDLGVLASRLTFSLQQELFGRLAAAGYGDLNPRHGAVLAYLDEDGIRATELARLSGLHKQVVGRLIDELEELGYVERRPDPADRRAKLIVPTQRGLEQLIVGDEIVAEIEARHAGEIGARDYARFRDVLRGVVARAGGACLSEGTVLISGAAGGIGSATVDRFLAIGYDVAGVDISPAVETLRTGDYGGKVADVTDPERLVAAVEELLDGRELRHVVGLAGRVLEGEPESVEPDVAVAVDGFSRSVSLNLTGQFALIQAALPKLSQATGDRSIVLCSSVNALRGYGAPAYSAAKAGLIGMTHVLAGPLGRQGIRINVVAPGSTRTPLVEEEIRAAKDPTRLERAAGHIPLGRVAEPDDIAAVIESLADRMTYVHDEVIRVDGGQLLVPSAAPAQSRLRRWLHNRPFR